MELAHIVIFAFNRPKHLKITVESLLRNKLSLESNVTVYCDGPRSQSDVSNVNLVRDFAKSIEGFKSLKIIEHSSNKGLSKSIIDGVTESFNHYESLIILEDDLLVSDVFLDFMNSSLDLYKDDNDVASVHGYCYPIRGLPSTFFIRGADCWGWATWKRSWLEFELDGKVLLKSILNRKLSFEFNLFGSYNYMKMLKNQINNKNDSWAIRWHASNFLANKLTLYPGSSYVNNIGMDGTGTHFKSSESTYDTSVSTTLFGSNKISIKETKFARNLFVCFFYKSKIRKVLNFVKNSYSN